MNSQCGRDRLVLQVREDAKRFVSDRPSFSLTWSHQLREQHVTQSVLWKKLHSYLYPAILFWVKAF